VPGLGLFTGVAAVSGFIAFASLHAARIGLDLWSTVFGHLLGVVVTCGLLFAKLPDRASAVKGSTLRGHPGDVIHFRCTGMGSTRRHAVRQVPAAGGLSS
jgi:hypothetical protein